MSDTLKSTESIEQTEPYLKQTVDADPAETQEWLESLEFVIKSKGEDRAKYILSMLEAKARLEGVDLPMKSNTPCLLYTSPSPRDKRQSRMPSSA